MDWISEYKRKTKPTARSRWINLLLDRIGEDIEAKKIRYDADKAQRAIDWIEENCYHTEGALAPSKIKLELWQKAFIASIFGLVSFISGERQCREVFLVVGRKNGKTLLASAVAKYIWQSEGGYGARIYCVAPKLAQADLIYDQIWNMTLISPEYQAIKSEIEASRNGNNRLLRSDADLPRHTQTDLRIIDRNAQVKKIAFSEKKSDGFNPSLTICDELASWEGDRGLKQYEVMKSAMGAREIGGNPALILAITTAGYLNDGIYDELFRRSTRWLKGDSRETRLLPWIYQIDDLDKWNDASELIKANPNMGVSVAESYLEEEAVIAATSASKKAEYLTKYCNIKQNSSLAWLDTATVGRCFGKPLKIEDFAHCYAVVGIDLSQTTDLTAAAVVIEKNGELNVFCRFWLPAAKLEEATARDQMPYAIYVQRGFLGLSGENFIDYKDVEDWLRGLVRDYEILPQVIGYDRYSAQYLVQDLVSEGFTCDDVYQGDNLYPTLMQAEGMMKDGVVHCGDNDLLKAHMLNAALKMNAERGRGRLAKLHPALHIDGLAALIDALTVREKWYGEIGDRLKNAEGD